MDAAGQAALPAGVAAPPGARGGARGAAGRPRGGFSATGPRQRQRHRPSAPTRPQPRPRSGFVAAPAVRGHPRYQPRAEPALHLHLSWESVPGTRLSRPCRLLVDPRGEVGGALAASRQSPGQAPPRPAAPSLLSLCTGVGGVSWTRCQRGSSVSNGHLTSPRGLWLPRRGPPPAVSRRPGLHVCPGRLGGEVRSHSRGRPLPPLPTVSARPPAAPLAQPHCPVGHGHFPLALEGGMGSTAHHAVQRSLQ